MHQHGTVDVDDVTRYIATGIGREQDGDAYQVVYLAVPAERDQLDQLGIPIARPLTVMPRGSSSKAMSRVSALTAALAGP